MRIATFPTSDVSCSALSSELNEPLIGTATRVDSWFLLEYPGPWRSKATVDNELARPVQSWLDRLVESAPAGRLQFIKQPQKRSNVGRGVAFFIAFARDEEARLFRLDAPSYEALLEIDTAAVLAGEAPPGAMRVPEPLFLVCTNGRRDRCCALHGVTLYEKLSAQVGDAVWQTTHLGGHRFAPTVLTLPDGYLYGRLSVEQASQFIVARSRGELILDHVRGRTRYEGVVQAADMLLRRETGEKQIDAYQLLTLDALAAGNEWRVRFLTTATGEIQQLYVRGKALDLDLLDSCGKPRNKPVIRYELRSHQAYS